LFRSDELGGTGDGSLLVHQHPVHDGEPALHRRPVAHGATLTDPDRSRPEAPQAARQPSGQREGRRPGPLRSPGRRPLGRASATRTQKSMPPMPPMPPSPPAGAGAGFSGLSAMTASVVRNRAAIEAAFCSAERVTLAGSGTPAASRSSYSPVAAFRP